LSVSGFLVWLTGSHHVASTEAELQSFVRLGGILALITAAMWIVYLALEPYVRKLWPDALLGWSRLLAGHFRDPRVGRDVLIGVGFGVTISLLSVAKATVIPALGFPAPYPRYGFSEAALAGAGAAFWGALLESLGALGAALFTILGIVLLRLVLRQRWLALIVVGFVMSLTATYDMNPGLPWSLAFPLASGVLLTVVTVRFGVLALVVARFTWGILETMPMTLNVSHWSAAASNWTLALLIGLTLFGFYASRAGQPLFGEIGKD